MYAYVFFAIYVCLYGALRAVTNTFLFAVFSLCISISTVILLIVLFSIYMYPYLYIYAYSTLRVLFFSITYLFCYIIFTHFYKYSNLNPIIFSYMYPYHICVLSAAYSLLLTYVLYFFKLLSISTVIL